MARRRSVQSPRRWGIPVIAAIVLVLAAGVFLIRHTPLGPRIISTVNDLLYGVEAPCCTPDIVLAPHNMPLVAHAISDIWREERARRLNYPERFRTKAEAVQISLMANGQVLAETWLAKGTILETLTTGINQLKRELSAEDRGTVDSLTVFLAHSPRPVDAENVAFDVMAQRHRGIRGYEVTYRDSQIFISPLDSLRNNSDMRSALSLYAVANNIDINELLTDASYKILDGEQIVVRLTNPPRAVLMERGNTYIPVEAVDRRQIRDSVELAVGWLVAHLSPNGKLAYGYRPSTRDVLPGDNLIRQWMATIALGRAGSLQYDFGFWTRAHQNLEYNLNTYFHQDEANGVVYREPDEVKLGAVALAALALHEQGGDSKTIGAENALNNTVTNLWQQNGAFQTFLRPPGTRRGENYYPGEALLYWAERYTRDRDPALLDRIMASFEYYRTWHRENRNPAFIGWHSQAYYTLWQVTQNDALKDFVFEMNDWLLNIQQWDLANQYRDTMGRFYAPGAGFGPPHASATGIYLEGLVDAFAMAREAGDTERAETYRLAILRGLRSIHQLQFQDGTDMFYVPRGLQKYVRGGIRTTVYDNTIRIDNVQHNLMAMLKVLRVFSPDDYTYPTEAN